MKFSFYPGNIYDSICRGHLTIEQLHNSIINPKDDIKELVDKVAKAKSIEEKHKLKSMLFYVTPAVYINKGAKRRYDNIQYHTCWMQIDFDKLNSLKEAEDFRDYLFNQYECIGIIFLSPSKLGVKGLLKIPRSSDVEEFKDWHKGVEDEMSQYDSWDHATFNCVLPMFISYDYDAKFRSDPITWSVKGNREIDYVHLNAVESDWGRSKDHTFKSLHTIAQFKKKIEEIASDDGHPRLRSACLVLGSRAGAGYIDVQQANELMHYMIQSNAYLSKKLNTYLKTADWCLSQGYNNPSYY